MSDFSHKPLFVDFGGDPREQKIKFVHSCTVVEVYEQPSWVEVVDLDYESHSAGTFHSQGSLLIRPIPGVNGTQYSDVITLSCDGALYYIPVVYSYDSTSVLVSDVVNNILMRASDVSPIGERDRMKAISVAKRWIQDNSGVSGTNIRFEEHVVENGIVEGPGDMVAPLGVYVVSDDGYLAPLYYNDNINIGNSPLQDDEGLYITDDTGSVIMAYGLTSRTNNDEPYTYYGTDLATKWSGFRNHYKVKEGEVSLNGMVRFDPSSNDFVITGPAIKSVVIKYLCDPILRNRLGLDDGELRVHKHYQEPLEAFIYYSLIEMNSAVPYNEKRRALQAYKLAKMRASVRNTNWDELIQVLRGR